MRKYLTVLIAAVVFSSCAPTKGYSGPELPESQVSLINYEYDSDTVEIGTANVDGISFGFSGISVLPGEHLFDLSVVLKDPPRFCRPFSEFDSYSYDACLKRERKGKGHCDCYEHIQVKESCIQTVYQGSCRGEAKTLPGRKYQVSVAKEGKEGQARIDDITTRQIVNPLSCSTAGSSEQELERSLGSGRMTAQQYGFSHHCY